VASLPTGVLRLQDEGLDIRLCDDLRSYNKIIHMLDLPERQFIVTADDDQYYHRTWLQDLVSAYRPNRKEIICGRAHRIRLDAQGIPLPYSQWEFNVPAGASQELLFPTGGGGVLYEPGIFHPDVTCKQLFLELCPSADDVWLYWMASMNSAVVRKAGPPRREITWPNSQNIALYKTLNRTGNDRQIARMISRYGFPPAGEALPA
jgi:hypothetical protein